MKDSDQICQPYTEVEAKQKNLPAVTKGVNATVSNERLYQYLATAKAPAIADKKVSKPVWKVIVNE